MYIPNPEGKIGTHQSLDSALRGLLTNLLAQYSKRSNKSREQIAEEMSVHTGLRISKRMLNDWTAESKKPARFPAFLIESFCEVTGDDRLQRWAVGKRLGAFLELGELCARILKQDKQIERTRRRKQKR
jgi:hypothetical protein